MQGFGRLDAPRFAPVHQAQPEEDEQLGGIVARDGFPSKAAQAIRSKKDANL
jgi:hypothetical protein